MLSYFATSKVCLMAVSICVELFCGSSGRNGRSSERNGRSKRIQIQKPWAPKIGKGLASRISYRMNGAHLPPTSPQYATGCATPTRSADRTLLISRRTG
jgi:hypothetical protein